LPKGLKKRPQRLAIDLTLIPYHGQPHRCSEEIYRSQAKSGTTHFHAYATCYVVHKGRRFTVVTMRVNQGTTMVEVLKCLLRQASRAGIRPSPDCLTNLRRKVGKTKYYQTVVELT
jgi:putative transposase